MTPRGVGIVGLSVQGGWAARAHVPAIAAVPGLELRAVLGSDAESTARTAQAFAIDAAGSAAGIAARPDIDLVVVAVRVPQHHAVIRAAAGQGAALLSEWPLATAPAEAADLVAATAGTPTFAGLQGRHGPDIRHVRELIHDGFVGEILSSTVVASGMQWGPTVAAGSEYLLDRANGATMLTIPFAHTLDTLQHVLGPLASVQAITATRRAHVTIEPGGGSRPMSAEDQVAIVGTTSDGIVLCLHYRGGRTHGPGLVWEVNGTQGDLRVTSESGHLQLSPASVWGSRRGADLRPLPTPGRLDRFPALAGEPAHQLAHAYAHVLADLRDGSATHPDFAHALRLHETLAAIQRSAAQGRRVELEDNP